jgi:hypothetical protein
MSDSASVGSERCWWHSKYAEHQQGDKKMFAANTYRIRLATKQDTDTLLRLAEQNSEQPLGGSVLIGEIDGVASAAMSLSDGRVIADASPQTGHLVANLRARAVSAWAYSATPSLNERLLAGLPAWYRAAVLETYAAEGVRAERGSVLAYG